MKKLRVLGLLVVSLTLVASVRAAKPLATLAVSPANPMVGDALVFTGCGYVANQGVTIVVESPYAYSWFGAPADSNGCIDSSPYEIYQAQQAGKYHAEAWQIRQHGQPDAQLDFVVEP
jgi:hypothetical protein